MATTNDTPGVGEKRCAKCKRTKPLDKFNNEQKSRDGKCGYCRDCSRIIGAASRVKHREKRNVYYRQWYAADVEGQRRRSQQWQRQNRGKCREYQLAKCYDITPEIYEEATRKQCGVCAICGRPESTKQRGHALPLAVDHDHDTGQLRGLLCRACNSLLGMACDNAARLEAAAAYLRQGGTGAFN